MTVARVLVDMIAVLELTPKIPLFVHVNSLKLPVILQLIQPGN
jgi:hypothetical protein